MPNFDVRDAYGSVITIESSVVGGANRQVVTAAITTGNSSVMLLNSAAVIGSVATLQGTNPWITTFSNSSILATQQGTVIASVINSAPSSLLTGASIFGQLPAGTAVLGSVATLQGTNPWITTFSNSSIFATQQGTHISSVVNSIPSSLLTGIHGHRNDAVARSE